MRVSPTAVAPPYSSGEMIGAAFGQERRASMLSTVAALKAAAV